MDNWVGRSIRSSSIGSLLGSSSEGDIVLDMGCGTGVEAHILSENGRTVFGFDPSHSMVLAARKAAPLAKIVQGSIEDLPNLASKYGWKDLDLVFSSLGPLNCIRDLEKAFVDASSLLKVDGRMVLSTMNRHPLLETLGLLLVLRPGKALERNKRVQMVNVGDRKVRTFYHSYSEIAGSLPGSMKIISVKALPFCLPPIRTARTLAPFYAGPLIVIDRSVRGSWPFNRLGDHLHIEMVKVHTG